MWLLKPPLWFVPSVSTVVECAGSACFPGCCYSSTSGTQCWSFSCHFSVVQDAVRVSHLLRSISCPSQWFPFEPALSINILYSSEGSTFFFLKEWWNNVNDTKMMSNVLSEFLLMSSVFNECGVFLWNRCNWVCHFALAKILKENRVSRAVRHFWNNTSIQIPPQIVAAHRLLNNRGNKKNTQGNRINTWSLE